MASNAKKSSRSRTDGYSRNDTRMRVGLIIPSSNNVLEWEFTRRLPLWASLHTARLYHTDADFDSLIRTHHAMPEAAAMVATVRPHLLVIGCTAVSGVDQGDFENELVPKMAKTVNAPVVTVLPNVIDWLQSRDCNRIVLVTPHGAAIDAVLVEALEGQGIAVRETHSMEIPDNFELGQVPVKRIESFVAERMKKPLGKRDALFLSCTNFRSAEALPSLRRRYGRNVVSSTQIVVERAIAELNRLRDRQSSRDTRPEEGMHVLTAKADVNW